MRILIIIAIIVLVACGDSNTNCDIEYGVPFHIEVGQTYCHSNGEELEILEFNISYCPCDANCVWEGELQVNGMLSTPDGLQSAINIHETRTENNTPNFTIISVTTTDECTPQVTSVQITFDPR